MAVIDKLPSGKWRVRVRRKGFPTRTRSFNTKLNAAGWARKIESELERGLWRDPGNASALTLQDAIEQYIGEVLPEPGTAAYKARAAGAERIHKGRDIELATFSVIGDDRLVKKTFSSITRDDINAFQKRMLAAGMAVGTVNRRTSLLSAVFNHARKKWAMWGLQNPAAETKLSGEKKRTRRASDEEIEAWLAATHSAELGSLVYLAVRTAARRSELAELTWDRVHLEKRCAHLIDTKNGEERDVPLTRSAVALLREMGPKQSGKVFGMQPHSFTTAARRALKRARALYEKNCAAAVVEPDPAYLVDLRIHDLRHEAASRAAPKLKLLELAGVTGHRDLRSLKRYVHTQAPALAAKLDRDDANGGELD